MQIKRGQCWAPVGGRSRGDQHGARERGSWRWERSLRI